MEFRPAAPSEPPAAIPGNDDPDRGPIDPEVWGDFETTCEPPAETQDFHPVGSRPCCAFPAEALRDDDHEPYADAYEWEPVATRPSAGTETLRDALLDVLGAVDELLRQPADGTPRGALADARDRARRHLDRTAR